MATVDAVPMMIPKEGSESVSAKASSGSTVVSPVTLTSIVLLVSPTANVTTPPGSTPPAKSDAAAALAPLPATDQTRVCAEIEAWSKVSVKV